jgi:alpha-galactosidase
MKKELIFKVVILIFACARELSCIDNGAGRTPPMGWSSKGTFNCSITENIIKQMADRMIDRGLASKGYSFVNIDDCWQASRNQSTGEILEDLSKFPHGMSELSKYIHSKGLKLGLYSDLGNKTCNGRPGSFGYEKIDAVTYANWS